MISRRTWLAAIATLACITAAVSAPETRVGQLSGEQMRVFLLNARVVNSKPAGKGTDDVLRLTLSDGKIVHDAAFQAIDQSKIIMNFGNGRSEMNLGDSYKYDIAAYELAKLLSLGDMMPVTVLRKCLGNLGALSWWLPVKMDEEARVTRHIAPPDPEAWNRQMYKMRVFSRLVYDTDRNLGNALISEDWHLWMIDFSRAFRLYDKFENAKNLARCDRQLLEKLRQLDAKDVIRNTKGLLTKPEVRAVMQRRDKIVAFFDALVAQKGEKEVLY
jgi:hypothetical protein